MLKLKLTILFLIVSLFSATQYKLNSDDKEGLYIYKYKVQAWENIHSVADKFHISRYTLRISNNIYYRDLREGEILLIPSKDVILFTLPSKYWSVQRVARKFYASSKDIKLFNWSLKPVEVEDFNKRYPYKYIAAVPHKEEKVFAWPVEGQYTVISEFGVRPNPFNRRYAEFHTGFDIPVPYKKIKAVKSGRVLFSGWLYGYGRCIIIEHSSSVRTLYAHLNRMLVRVGAYVHQNMTIAESGNTGRSTGPHLHFEIRINNNPVNPWRYYNNKGVI